MKVLSITQQRRPGQVLAVLFLASGFAFAGGPLNPPPSDAVDVSAALGGVDAIGQPIPSTTPDATALAAVFPGAVISNIEDMPGWESCTTCAGRFGSGTTAPYGLSRSASPSLDGNSAHFWLGGSTPYSNALWWKQLGAKPAAHNFVYDFYFYLTNPGVSQAIEFDMNQSVDGRKLIFGTECDIVGKHWDVWDTANSHWVNTGVYCGVPPAYTWNHVTLEFQRTSGDQARFVAITLNGQKSYINRTFNSQGSGVNELNVAVQLDGNHAQANYDMWVDGMRVNYW